MPDNRGGYQPAAPGTPDERGPINQVPNNQPYGQRQALERSLSAVPMAGSNTATKTPVPTTSADPNSPNLPVGPGDIPSLTSPTMYPAEPLTSGLSTGPGAGPESLHLYAHGNEELSILRGVYAKFANEDLRKLIEWMEGNS